MDEDIRQLVQKNLELTEKIARDVKKIRHHFWMANVWGIVKIFIIFVLPIYLSYVYLGPYVQQLQSMFQQLQGIQKDVAGFQKSVGDVQKNFGNLQNLPQQLPQGAASNGALQDALKNIPGLESFFGDKK